MKFIFVALLFVTAGVYAEDVDYSSLYTECNPGNGPVQIDCEERRRAATESLVTEAASRELRERYHRDSGGLQPKAWCEKIKFGSNNPDDWVKSCVIAIQGEL